MLSFTVFPYDYYGPTIYTDVASGRIDRGLVKESPEYFIKYTLTSCNNVNIVNKRN